MTALTTTLDRVAARQEDVPQVLVSGEPLDLPEGGRDFQIQGLDLGLQVFEFDWQFHRGVVEGFSLDQHQGLGCLRQLSQLVAIADYPDQLALVIQHQVGEHFVEIRYAGPPVIQVVIGREVDRHQFLAISEAEHAT